MPTQLGGVAMKLSLPQTNGRRTPERRKVSSWPRSQVCAERVTSSDAESNAPRTTSARSQSNGFANRLWREHDLLASQLTHVETAADAMSSGEELTFGALRAELDRAYELLAGQIIPHMRAADEYRTALARRDYVSAPARPEREEAERLTSKLARVRDCAGADNIAAVRRETGRVLYELHALTRPHFGDPRDLRP